MLMQRCVILIESADSVWINPQYCVTIPQETRPVAGKGPAAGGGKPSNQSTPPNLIVSLMQKYRRELQTQNKVVNESMNLNIGYRVFQVSAVWLCSVAALRRWCAKLFEHSGSHWSYHSLLVEINGISVGEYSTAVHSRLTRCSIAVHCQLGAPRTFIML